MRFPAPRPRHRGFTLIELMAALAIAALLGMVAVGAYQRQIETTRRAEGRAAVLDVLTQQQWSFSRTGRFQAFTGQADARGFRWHTGDRPDGVGYHLQATACDASGLQQCVRVSALPFDWTDTTCAVLWANSRGQRGEPGCW